ELARNLDELQRIRQLDGVHLLPGTQARELWFLLVILGADLHEGSVTAHAHGDRLAVLGMFAELARHGDFFARDVFLDVIDLRDERLPEFLERLSPRFL